jgi:hypothetical protein
VVEKLGEEGGRREGRMWFEINCRWTEFEFMGQHDVTCSHDRVRNPWAMTWHIDVQFDA